MRRYVSQLEKNMESHDIMILIKVVSIQMSHYLNMSLFKLVLRLRHYVALVSLSLFIKFKRIFTLLNCVILPHLLIKFSQFKLFIQNLKHILYNQSYLLIINYNLIHILKNYLFILISIN